MPLYDLNVPWTPNNVPETRRTAVFLKELGYDVLALTHTLIPPLPAEIACPIPDAPFPVPRDVHLLKRCTLILVDTASNYRLPALNSTYDLLALRPTSEKTLGQSCRDLECDLISLDLTQRYDFPFKGKTLMQAVERGILIELCYGPAVLANDSIVRRNVISNTTQVIRATRGRGLIISSQAQRVSGCRGPADVVNLASVWGLGPEKGRDALQKGPRLICATAALKRKSYRGVVEIVYGGEKPAEKSKQVPQHAAKGNESQKRKADAIEGTGGQAETIEKPLSKREMKRRRKKELLARRQGEDEGNGETEERA